MFCNFYKYAFAKIKKCPWRKKLKEGFRDYMLQNVDGFKIGLTSQSLKYAVWFGHNMSIINPKDRMLFKDIKLAIRKNLGQMDAELCMMTSDLLANYKCQGDEQDIMMQLKKYLENNADQFDEGDIRKFEDNLYVFNQQTLPFMRMTPKLNLQGRQESFAKKQIRKLSIDTKPFLYGYTSLNSKLTLNAEKKSLKIVGIQHSIEWIESMRKELDRSEGIIMELQPHYQETREQNEEDYDTKLENLIGTIRGVPSKATAKTNTPFIIKDIKAYLKSFPSEGLVVFHKQTEDDNKSQRHVDEQRSLLKHISSSVQSVLLADLTIDEEIIELSQRYTLPQIREFYAFLRMLFINEQGRYLQQVSKSGCPECGGSAVLLTPMNVADSNFYPLDVREKFMAKNIHHYIKSTDYKNYSCFVGEDHVFPIFKHLSQLYKSDNGWTSGKSLNDLESIRPKYTRNPDNQKQKEEQLNKICILESLYSRGLTKLPLELKGMQELHNRLLMSYAGLLQPFRLDCDE